MNIRDIDLVSVIIEHICTYTMRRQQHELAEIVHGMIVTVRTLIRFSHLIGEYSSSLDSWRVGTIY